MSRLREKNELFIKLGALFGPLQRLVERPQDYNEQEKAEIIARFAFEKEEMNRRFGVFAAGQAGHDYHIERRLFIRTLGYLLNDFSTGVDLSEAVSSKLALAQSAIAAIPIPSESVILDAGSPFSTYCILKDLCESDATNELIWIDAYLDSTIFHRYLRGVREDVSVTLVTEEPRTGSRRDQQRWNEFLDISRLYSQERGNHYRLVVYQAGVLHDRWVCFDAKRVFSLGGSVKDASNRQYFTLARLDSSPENLQKIQAHVGGPEYFGPSGPNHR